MVKTKARAKTGAIAQSSPTADMLQDALKDALIPASAFKRTEVVAGPKPDLTATRGDTGDTESNGGAYRPYPNAADRTVRGTTKHEHSLNKRANGSALVVNSSDKRSATSDNFSFSDALHRYTQEHPEWSEERRMTMASREDPNNGGDVVSAKRRDGGGTPKTGRKFAGVIKNVNYKHMKKLDGVEADAERTKSQWLGEGFPTLVRPDLTGPGIVDGVDDVLSNATPGAQINLYFGGHGTNLGGFAGINAFRGFAGGRMLMADSVPYSVIGTLASQAVSEGWHLKAIIDCCESGAVAEAVNEALKSKTESTQTTAYDVQTDELREKGLPGADERWKGQQMEEILYKQFVDSGGLLGYGDSDGS